MESVFQSFYVFVTLLTHIKVGVCINEHITFYGVTDLDMQSAISTVTNQTDIACAGICRNVNGCISFSFATSTDTCKLFDTDWLIDESKSVVTGGSTLFMIDCERGWKKFGDSCYLFSTEARSWVSSKAYCESVGANLVKVTHDEEHQFIRQIISAKSKNFYWIGARYNSTTHDYRWIDGTVTAFNGWYPGLPGAQKGCVDYLKHYNWQWNSHSNCVSTNGPCICEKGRL